LWQELFRKENPENGFKVKSTAGLWINAVKYFLFFFIYFHSCTMQLYVITVFYLPTDAV